MRFHFAALALTVLGAHEAFAKEVAVLVHGLGGFGPDELFGINYWAESDELEKEGFEVHRASVGPVSSNWDRACELFAQIKGTRVDYGEAHSTKYGHERFGKDYTGKGFMPTWGPDDRVHLMGHSMGGQTIRMLEVLLQEGDQEEIDAGATSPLFTKAGNWIKTMTSFSAPHDGSTLVDILGDGIVDFIKTFILAIVTLTQDTLVDLVYDFDLDHFNLKREAGESWEDYMDRIMSAEIWDPNFLDLAPYDLSPAGSVAMQMRGKQSYEGTYYFGIATERTFPIWGCDLIPFRCGWKHKAEPSMWLPLMASANLMGGLSQDSANRENDGLVSVESSKCPKLAYGGVGCIEFDGIWREGVWNWQKVSRDHIQIMGFTLLWPVNNLFRDHARRINVVSDPNYSSAQLIAARDLPPSVDSTSGMVQMPVAGVAAFGAAGGIGMLAGIAALVVHVRSRRAATAVVAGKADDKNMIDPENNL